ncbi:MAG: hypothetical protein E6I41_00740 [Chloroflexi bacterium]|nr:MAG: hypothetical protein E6I41_00740 [Chloroflexota bacterium]
MSAPPLTFTGTMPEAGPSVMSSWLAPVLRVRAATWTCGTLMVALAAPLLTAIVQPTLGLSSRLRTKRRL